MSRCRSVRRQTYLVDGFVERHLIQRWRTRKSHDKLPHVRIDHELRRQTNWPPPSQLGGSLVDIMRLENSFFQAEQADEMLLPKSASGDTLGSSEWPHSELGEVNEIVLRNNVKTADSCTKPNDLSALSAVNGAEPQPYDGTVL